MKLIEQYSDEDACREMLAKLRWPDGVTCPRCGSKINLVILILVINTIVVHAVINSPLLTGTIFQDTHLPLQNGLWLFI